MVGAYIVNEPDKADDKKTPAVELERKHVRRLRIAHRVSGKFLGLFHKQTENKKKHGKHDANS